MSAELNLRIHDLCFDYGHVCMLKNINLEVFSGDFLGILGPNGSGKSTLVKNILGILHAKSGEIEIFGKNLKSYSIKELSKIIGFVPQKSALFVPLLVVDVLLMGRYSQLKHSYSSYDEKDLQEVEALAKKLNIQNFLQRNILSLSGGEFQRVLLARALLKKPKILLLDEPTSALDLNYALELLSECENLLKEQNISVVAILHDLNLASLFCNKIIFLKDGELRYQGNVQELFKKEILKEIYDLNCEVLYHDNRPYILTLKEK
ncbi:ABC transporter ATP-binding protein [Campylobacter sp. MIT 99-7217]|uniref:ABC transporter ATP-binding protein n=1 Tax=Campylobacter sp. MIT 99-7217 TaxID=535091 RepID=UPI00115A5D3D|nr:ABC transporter ATP-binding protein [Campylobacter sp. MIT 99-7217]TQR32428.1 ABC transporter ATP-binding protein [Campylobacter sp. MIT 99-7217]